MANAILEEIYSVFGVDVLSNEAYYLAQHLIAANNLVDEMISRVAQIVGIDFSGEVAKLGDKVKYVKLVSRVTVAPLIPCSHCSECE